MLPSGTVQEVKDGVHRNIETLVPCGGFVFYELHKIQGEVSSVNI
ncbi:hypothetical protein [Mariniphaga sp.]